MVDCMRWPGTHRKDGRPVFEKKYVYRIAFEQRYGRLLKNQVLHHLCGHVWCINPEHLAPMLQGEHLKVHGNAGDWGQRFKTHCPKGHPYAGENLYQYGTERRCKACHREAKLRYMKAWRERNVKRK